MKLSVSLIDTYKHINTVYYEERDARRAAKQKEKKGSGSNNNGWDDDNYDYLFTAGELFFGRYKIRERIGKGSFGQVVRAEDMETNRDVAIKIIKSKKPFLLQAKTEIELLTHLWEKDPEDQHNIGTLQSFTRIASHTDASPPHVRSQTTHSLLSLFLLPLQCAC
jgi:dual specificity tyrosine-phosphorylation-regulated kinase 1